MRRTTVVLCIAAALAACTQPQQGYPPGYEVNFVRGCETQGAPREVCTCVWARVAAEVPRADLDALERAPAAERASMPANKQLEGFAAQCMTEYQSRAATP